VACVSRAEEGGLENGMKNEGLTRAGFVRLGAGVTLAGAGLGLAGCGGGGAQEGNGGGGGGGQAGPAATDSGVTGGVENAPEASGEAAEGEAGGEALAAESDLQPGSAVEFDNEGQPAVLVRLDSGDFAAYSAVCTHAQCTVAYGDGNLACPCHGSVFDPADGGAVVQGPASRPLPEVAVEVRDGQVFKA